MIQEGVAAVAVAMTIAVTSAFLVRPLLRRLPEPIPGDGKPIYRDLGTTRFVLVCGALAGVAAAISWLTVPRYAQPMWSVLAILGVLLAAIAAPATDRTASQKPPPKEAASSAATAIASQAMRVSSKGSQLVRASIAASSTPKMASTDHIGWA